MSAHAEYVEALSYSLSHLAGSALFAFNSNADFVTRVGPAFAAAARNPASGFRPVLSSILKGESREFRVSKTTAGWIEKSFDWRDRRMGGQAGIMANAASALGVEASAYAIRLSPEQCSLFTEKITPCGNKSALTSKHFVFEFAKGARILGKTIPATDRVIASHDPAHSSLAISALFKRQSVRLAPSLDCAVVSGFQGLSPGFAGRRIPEATRLVRAWKKENPGLRVCLELGDFASGSVLRKTLETLLPAVDSLGMNELEASASLRALGLARISQLSAKVPEMVVHQKEGSRIYGFSPREGARKAAMFGHMLAAFKARTGTDAAIPAIKRFMGERHAYSKFSGIPSIREKPKFTVGLGDTFAAGFALVR
ncbi:MAG: ADP-dependent glucokinase/phosphofructokinase [Candidatus ainarchaeum sp.]|nr:ADP-dependent glucokinase/phosphofructokinase [Candidatus ainarchaeum sp.]